MTDDTLELVAQYVYDAWGNHKVFNAEGVEVQSTEKVIANMNPFRYRSYYFDVETNLYYLQTRYYDATIGRFIFADSIEYLEPETLGGLNLYAYCGNNPVVNIDSNGTFWFTLLTTVIGAVVGAVAAVVTSIISDEEITWKKVLGGAISGAVTGFILGISKGAAIAAASYASAAAESLFYEVWDYASGEKELNGQNILGSLAKVGTDTLVNGTINYVCNKTAASIGPIKTNANWFTPKHFLSYFTKSFGQKMILQTLVAGGIGVMLYSEKNKISKLVQKIKNYQRPPMYAK